MLNDETTEYIVGQLQHTVRYVLLEQLLIEVRREREAALRPFEDRAAAGEAVNDILDQLTKFDQKVKHEA
jgi:hypothetical protein